MTTTLKHQIVPEYRAEDLGVPFEVILLNSVKQAINEKTGEVEKVIIPNLRGLVKCVAITRICVPRKLSGNEIKFVRKAFKLPAKKVAEMIDISPEHLSRCEAGDRLLSPSAEKCLRVSIFLEHFKSLEKLESQCKEDKCFAEKLEKIRSVVQSIGAIISEMKIEPAFDSSPLELRFETVTSMEETLFEDDPNADWHSNDAQPAMAA